MRKLAQRLGKPPGALRIWDPYYCAGGVKARLGALGFGDVVNEFSNLGITFDDTNTLQFVAATSNQANALNQDLGGIDGGINASATWAALGGFSVPTTINPVPEPGTGLLMTSGLLGLAFVGRPRPRRAQRSAASRRRARAS